MPLVKLDSFLTVDVIKGRIEAVESRTFRVSACSEKLQMSDHRK